MKKLMFLLLFAGMTFSAFAQETATVEIPTQKHKVVTNGFCDNWFVGFGADFISNYSSQEVGVSGSPFSAERGSWGGNVTLGKWVTPSLGVRFRAGFGWGRQINSSKDAYLGPDIKWDNDLTNPEFTQLTISLQPMLNLHNLFAGYKPRVWNTILYASVSYHRNFVAEYNSPLVGLGWWNVFNISERFNLNVDIFANMGEKEMDGNNAATGAVAFGTRDWQIGASVGFGVNLGKVGWDNAPDVDAIMAMNKAQLDALNASLAEQQAEHEQLKKMIKNHKCPEGKTVVEIKVASSVSLFFNINRSKIASKKDLVNLKELAEFAKANGKVLVVTGYADSNTGSADYNQKLSVRRAETVAEELVEMGVSRDKIELVGKGGVKDLTPISYNRRVIVSVK